MTPEKKLQELGLTLIEPATPLANYVPIRKAGNLLFVSGQLSSGPSGLVTGKLGLGLDVEEGQKAAAFAATNILSHVVYSGNIALADIKAVQKITVLVASTPEFVEHHLVANGASDLLVHVLGEAGKHARAAFGVAALPLNAAVEIDAVIEI